MVTATARDAARRAAALVLTFLTTVAIVPAASAVQVYYSVGTSRSVPTDLKAGAPTVTISAGVATFSLAQPNNVGVGDEISHSGGTLVYVSGRQSPTQYTVTDRLGAVPADVVGATVDRIYRAFATLSAAVAGSSNGAHLGTTILTGAGNYQLNWPCYADGPMVLAPSAEVVITGYTTGPSNYIRVYTPVSSNEVGVSQRHRGVWGTGFRLEGTNADTIQVEDNYVRIEGLTIQATVTTSGNWGGIWSIPNGTSDVRLSHNVIKGVVTAGNNAYGIAVGSGGADVNKVSNNVIFNFTNAGGAYSNCITIDVGFAYVFSNTLYNCETGIRKWNTAAGAEVRNNAAIHNTVANPAYVDYFDLAVAPAAVRSDNVSSDASSETVALRNKTAFAAYFRNTAAGTEDLHITSSSFTLWGANGANLAANPNLAVTNDIDGGPRVRPDIGADEFGTCCALSAAETGSTVTVTGAGQFEMVFNTLRGGGIDDFFDIAEDPGRTLDLAGRDSLNLWGLFHTSMEAPAGTLYTTGTNSSGAKLDLLEATVARVKVRQESFYQRVLPATNILPGVKGIGDYSVYGERVALGWNRRTTAPVPDQDDHALEITAHREAAGVLNPMSLYSQSGSAFPAPAGDDFVLAQREVAGSPGVRTDFLGIQSSDWAAADSLTASITGSYFSWRDETDNQALAAGLDEKWNFLVYYKPTTLLDNTDLAVTSRSSDYRTPSAVSVGPGSQWQDASESTAAALDFFNEAEAAYLFTLNPATGLTFSLDGSTTTRYTPFFKIRQWRSFVESPNVTLDADSGGPAPAIALARDAGYRAAVKPVSRAHFTTSLRWHCTLDDTSVTNTCTTSGIDLDVGGSGGASGVTMVPARYGYGAAFDANTDYVSAPSNVLTEFDPGSGAVDFWYQPNQDHTVSGPLVFWYTASADDCFVFEKAALNALRFTIRKGAASNCTSGGTTYQVSVPSGSYSWRGKDWVHLRATWTTASLGRMAIWMNGVELAFNTGYNSSTVTSGSTLVFGGCSLFCPLGSTGNADGILDEVSLYALPSEPTSIAHAGRVGAADEYLADSGFNTALGLARVDASKRGRYLYFGADSKFLGLNVSLATVGLGVADTDVVWQYWRGGSGAWVTLAPSDGTRSFKQTGTVSWADPSGWTPMSVNGGPDLYYVRAHLPVTATADYSQTPVERQIRTDILLFQYCGDVTTNATFAFAVPPTTEVKLQSFTASPGDRSIGLEWRTASELDNLGFHVYRSQSEGGPWTRLTASLIPGLGSSATGQAYAFTDSGLENGTRYFYLLEDVDARSRATRHGPVSAVPAAGALPPPPGGEPVAGGPASSRKSVAASPSCPGWVVTAYAEVTGSSGPAMSITCTRHGDADAVSLAVLSRDARQATLELRTGGFYSVRTLSGVGEASGRVRVFVPGLDFPQDPEAPALPVRRVLVEAVVGRRVQLGGVRALEPAAFPGLVPVSLGRAEMRLGRDGTVQAGRRVWRELAPRRASLDVARLLPSVFQGETKSAVVEITPLRFDAQRRRLVLARRVLVKLLFTGRETEESGRGSLGRRRKPEPPVSGEVLARLYTSGRGLHAVSFEQLFSGATHGLRASQLSLERQGSAVAAHIEPAGETFGPGSVLYFHSDVAAASTDFSSEVAWELRLTASGARMPLVAAAPSGTLVTASSTGRATFESERFYQPGLLEAPDPWLWEALVSGAARALSFPLAGVVSGPGRTVELDVHLQGASESGNPVDHHVSVSLNGAPAGEAQFAGKRPYRVSLSVDASLLRDGANELLLTSLADTGASSLVFLDRFTLSYPQAAGLAGGVFEGRFDADGLAEVAGATGPVALLDVTAEPARWLTGYAAAGGSLRFRAEAGRRYLAVSQPGLLVPRIAAAAPSSLRSATNQADYLLITPRAFLAAAAPLVARREGQGLAARAVAFEEIADEFGHGRPSAEAISAFVAHAFQAWARPSPRYVVLLGDASYDPRNFTGVSQPSPLPALWTKTSYLWTASDPLLAAVNGEDALPDLAIGRLPATTAEQAHELVAKLIAWEASGHGLAGAAALVADNPDVAGDFDADVDAIANGPLAGRATTLLKLSELGGGMRPAIRAALDGGLSLLSYVGHGGAAVWASENVWNTWDAASLQAQSRQPLLVTMNCLNGYFVAPSYDSLAESLVKAEGRGAIAAFSPSGLSLDGPAHVFHRALVAELTSGRHARLGDAVVAAQAAYAASGLMPELLSIYQLLGDPAMGIR